jgi:hypothetical protein
MPSRLGDLQIERHVNEAMDERLKHEERTQPAWRRKRW